MCSPILLDPERPGPLGSTPSGRAEVLDATGTKYFSHLGYAHIWDAAVSPRLGFSVSSICHHVDRIQPIPEPTSASSTSSSTILTWPKPSSIEQPGNGPKSQDHPMAELKDIYVALVITEIKCIEVGKAQFSVRYEDANIRLNDEQSQALILFQRIFLQELQDFFLASQLTFATAPPRRLSSKYVMLARIWDPGIYPMDLFYHELPSAPAHGHIRTLTYFACSMMELLYDTVPKFEETWIDYLCDMGRHRMAIEVDDIRTRTSDSSPNTGGLYHHLAILTEPNTSINSQNGRTLSVLDGTMAERFNDSDQLLQRQYMSAVTQAHFEELELEGTPNHFIIVTSLWPVLSYRICAFGEVNCTGWFYIGGN
ncbi:hypothetical protein FPOA_09503 [Fusarium poae]|uniref:Uncharacterized protein n=1 Tax=Fusarium poae TaxID=36050 RepID=A0A1B8ABB4_FUSPO|nr:hypothetical protein FPOA_09503 [Fusarium poae]